MDEKYIQQLYQDLVRRYGANHMMDYDTFSSKISTDDAFQKQTYSDFQKQYGANNILSYDDFSGKVKKKVGGNFSSNGSNTSLQNQNLPTQNINADATLKLSDVQAQQQPQSRTIDANALNVKHGQVAAQNNELGQYGAIVQQATQEKKKQDTDNAINNTAVQWAESQPKLAGIYPKLTGTKLQELQKNSLFQNKVSELSNQVKNGDLIVSGEKLARPMSMWQNMAQGWNDASKAKKEADNFWGANKDERIKMLNQKQPDEGYLPLKPDTESLSYSASSAAPGVSKMVGGGVVGTVAATALAPFTGGTSLEGLPIFASILFSGDDMARTGFHAGLQKYYQRAKQENPNISDSAAYDKAYNMAVAGEAESLGTGIGLTAIGGNSLPQGSGQGLLKATGQFLLKQPQSISEVGALSGLGSFGKDLIAKANGFKVSGGEMTDNVTESMKQMAIMQLAFNIGFGAINSPKYLKAQASEVLSKANPEIVQRLTNEALQNGTLTNEQVDKANKDLSDYQAAQKRTITTGNEEKDAVVTGLIQKKTNLEKAKENVDKSYHKELDAQIEAVEQKIQVAKNSDNPTFVETDDLTGEHNLNSKEYDKLTAQEKDGIDVKEDYGKSETEQVGKDEEKKFKPVAYFYEEKGGFKLKHEIEVGDKTYSDKEKAKDVAERALRKHYYENGMEANQKPQRNERANTIPEEKIQEEAEVINPETNAGINEPNVPTEETQPATAEPNQVGATASEPTEDKLTTEAPKQTLLEDNNIVGDKEFEDNRQKIADELLPQIQSIRKERDALMTKSGNPKKGSETKLKKVEDVAKDLWNKWNDAISQLKPSAKQSKKEFETAFGEDNLYQKVLNDNGEVRKLKDSELKDAQEKYDNIIAAKTKLYENGFYGNPASPKAEATFEAEIDNINNSIKNSSIKIKKSESVSEEANKRVYNEENTDNSIVEQPTENISQPINTEQNAISERSTETASMGEASANSAKMGERVPESGQTTNAQKESEGTSEEKNVGGEGSTSLKNAVVNAKIEKYGLKPTVQSARREFGVSWDEAMDKIENGYDPYDLINELKKKPRPLTDTENAILLFQQAVKERELDAAATALNEASEKGDATALEENKIRRARLEDELQDIYNVGKAVGTENARGLVTRKRLLADNYSIANMKVRKRAANDGKPLTEEQQTEINKQYDKIHSTLKAYEERIKELENQVVEKDKKLAEQAIHKEVNKEIKQEKIKKKSEQIKKDLSDNFDELRKIARNHGLSANPIPIEMIPVIGKISKNLVRLGVTKIEAITTKIYDELSGSIKDLKVEDVMDALQAAYNDQKLSAYKERLKTNIEKTYDKLNRGDFSKRQKQSIELDAQAIKLKANYERAKEDYELGLKKDELAKRSNLEKGLDTFVRWARAFKLSSPLTLAKLASAALTRIVITPAEEAIGGIYSKILPKSVTSKAIGEAGFNVKAEAKALTKGFTQGLNDAADIIRLGRKGGKGKSDLDLAFGKKGTLPPEAIDFLGQLHSALKAVPKRAAFERSFEKRITNAIKNGVDVSNEMVKTQIAMQAYKDANRAIFMQDNFLSDGYRNWVNTLDNSKKYPTAGKISSSVLNFLVPFVKVPTNIVGETVTGITGLPVAGAKILHTVFTKGLENLSVDEADFIIRNMKKGSLGVGALLLGYFNPTTFGGYYQPFEERDQSELKANQLKVFNQQIPSWLLHSPLFEVMQLGATVRRVKDKYEVENIKNAQKHKPLKEPFQEGIWAGLMGLTEQVPLFDQPVELAKLLDPKERQYYLGELVKNTIDPGLLQQVAKAQETGLGSLWTEQYQHHHESTILEHVESGLPFLREQVPTTKPKEKSTSGTMAHGN